MRRSPRMDVATLSSREIDIVNGVIQGSSNKIIAKKLGVAEQTVKNRLRRIFAMLQVSNRVELALYAVKQGLTAKD
jgi:two-component system nitrate/nitrite response regulator NarL